MAHAVSLTYARFDHISPVAVAMTTLLHVAVAAALWWVSPLRPVDPFEDAVAVTVEQETPPAEKIPEEKPLPEAAPSPPPVAPTVSERPPSPPPQAASPSPQAAQPPVRWGLAPAKPDADKPKIVGEPKPGQPSPQTPADEATQPDPPKPEAQKEQQQALATPPPPSEPPPPEPPAPSLETVLPPVEAPPPPLTSREIPRPLPPVAKPPPPPPPPPQTAQRPAPAPAPVQRPMPNGLQSSPLSNAPQRAPADQQASRQSSSFQNPADMYGQRKAESEYLWFIARKVSQHQQFVGNTNTESGTVELRLTIARSGQLRGVVVSRSSGISSLDSTSVNIVNQAGPYAPLPPELPGAEHTFTLPLYYKRS